MSGEPPRYLDSGTPKRVARGALEAPPEIIAAIAAAVELCWPRAAPASDLKRDRHGPEYVWRFSGRWWSKPVPLRRDRPWTDHHREHGQVGTGGS